MTKIKYFITVGKNPFGGTFFNNKEKAIDAAKLVKLQFPLSDVVVWENANDPFEIWENGNPE